MFALGTCLPLFPTTCCRFPHLDFSPHHSCSIIARDIVENGPFRLNQHFNLQPLSSRWNRALLERHSRPMRRLESTATVGTDPVCVRLRDVQRPFSDLHDPTNDKPVGYVSNFHGIDFCYNLGKERRREQVKGSSRYSRKK